MKKTLVIFTFKFLIVTFGYAQVFTHADTLRGTYGRSRDWWDVTKYDLHVTFNLSDSTIAGFNDMQFKILKPGKLIQIDLQSPLHLDSVLLHYTSSDKKQLLTTKLDFRKDGNAYFTDLPKLPSQLMIKGQASSQQQQQNQS